MDRLTHEPKTFRDIVESDLRRAARLIIKVQDEIDWQIRVATADGDYHLAITMPDDDCERRSMLRRIATFLQWKGASGFVLAVETREPDGVYAVGVSGGERVNCRASITRHPQPWTILTVISILE